MPKIRSNFQHLLNPLHVYCRLRSIGVAHRAANRVCGWYERVLYRQMLT